MIKYLKLRAKSINLSEENIGGNLHDPRFGIDFLNTRPKSQATKEKIGKFDFIKIKTFVYQRTLSRE